MGPELSFGNSVRKQPLICCTPLPGEINVQNIPYGPVYSVGFAGQITLCNMKPHDIPVEAWPPKLRSSEVPEAAVSFIPLAERYGLSDDGYRDDLVHGLDAAEVGELLAYLKAYPSAIDEWLWSCCR